MSKGHFVAMGQVGLTGWARAAAQPVGRWIARRTGRPEAENLSLIGAAFLATTLIGFLRDVDAVIAAGRTGPPPANDPPAGAQGRAVGRRHPPLSRADSGRCCGSPNRGHRPDLRRSRRVPQRDTSSPPSERM
jgi:hypothetical protein